MTGGVPAGPWLRVLAAAATVATAFTVASGDWTTTHYGSALVTLALVVAVFLAARLAHRERTDLVAASGLALAVYVAQIAVGALVAVVGDSAWANASHIALGGGSLAAATVATALALRGSHPVAAGHWRDYVTLTKPRIMTLLLLTAAGGFVLGARGIPAPGPLLATLGGLALACGGASALNHVLDRDIDRFMRRTDRRPVAAGRVPPSRALEFGLALSAFSFVVLASLVNVLAALLAVFGNLFYVLVYTRWLKRSTPQNIVIGGAAGAVPPVVGWAGATGDLTLPALLLFLIVFFWTPPHFWALALLIRRDYEAARIPMLPVVKGERETARSIVRYTLVLVAVTLLPVVAHSVGVTYLAVAVVLGGVFLALSVALLRQTTAARARRLFSFSLVYLALLFAALALDPIVAA